MKSIQVIQTKPAKKASPTRAEVIAKLVATRGSSYSILRQVRAAH